jgi:hypothetical protein
MHTIVCMGRLYALYIPCQPMLALSLSPLTDVL